ncbi:MAG: thrombospondin type 3 repeat-containing protein [Polyangiaceae bacterium]|nr:thrombospondin type 3 repeat-containing protein [Polyangiaceae bacterium]
MDRRAATTTEAAGPVQPGGGAARPTPGARPLATAATVALAALAGCRPTREPLSGWDVQTVESRFPAVVGVTYGRGIATGVALSDRVVATAGHLALDIVRGCRTLRYRGGAKSMSSIEVHVADEAGNVFGPGAIRYEVDAVSAQPRLVPANTYECCQGAACDTVCRLPEEWQRMNFVPPFDVLLLHLDRPLVGVVPLRFVARIGDTDEAGATYPIDPESWAGKVIATVVGVGDSDPGPALRAGPRRFGPAAFMGLGWKTDRVVRRNGCNPFEAVPFACDLCMLDTTPMPNDLLPKGGMRRTGGDSGAPVIVNYTAVGGTPIDGLPDDEPFVVGFGSGGNTDHDYSAASWDSTLPSGESTGTGTFILRHLRDWDEDGVPDAADNCVLTPNLDQQPVCQPTT